MFKIKGITLNQVYPDFLLLLFCFDYSNSLLLFYEINFLESGFEVLPSQNQLPLMFHINHL